MEQVGTQIKRMQATAAADRADLYGFFKKICENQHFQRNQRHQRAIFLLLKVVSFIYFHLPIYFQFINHLQLSEALLQLSVLALNLCFLFHRQFAIYK